MSVDYENGLQAALDSGALDIPEEAQVKVGRELLKRLEVKLATLEKAAKLLMSHPCCEALAELGIDASNAETFLEIAEYARKTDLFFALSVCDSPQASLLMDSLRGDFYDVYNTGSTCSSFLTVLRAWLFFRCHGNVVFLKEMCIFACWNMSERSIVEVLRSHTPAS